MSEKHNHDKDGLCDNPNCLFHDAEKKRRFLEAIEDGRKDGLIKVGFDVEGVEGVNKEWMWARPLYDGLVVILNVPFFADVGLHDVVEVEGDGFQRDAVRVVERMSRSRYMQYRLASDADFGSKPEPTEELRALVSRINKHFGDNNVPTEGMWYGTLVLSQPIDMENEYLNNLVEWFKRENPDAVIKLYGEGGEEV